MMDTPILVEAVDVKNAMWNGRGSGYVTLSLTSLEGSGSITYMFDLPTELVLPLIEQLARESR
jgi:hypothetical protein